MWWRNLWCQGSALGTTGTKQPFSFSAALFFGLLAGGGVLPAILPKLLVSPPNNLRELVSPGNRSMISTDPVPRRNRPYDFVKQALRVDAGVTRSMQVLLGFARISSETMYASSEAKLSPVLAVAVPAFVAPEPGAHVCRRWDSRDSTKSQPIFS